MQRSGRRERQGRLHGRQLRRQPHDQHHPPRGGLLRHGEVQGCHRDGGACMPCVVAVCWWCCRCCCRCCCAFAAAAAAAAFFVLTWHWRPERIPCTPLPAFGWPSEARASPRLGFHRNSGRSRQFWHPLARFGTCSSLFASFCFAFLCGTLFSGPPLCCAVDHYSVLLCSLDFRRASLFSKGVVVVRPAWVLESCREGRKLPCEPHFLPPFEGLRITATGLSPGEKARLLCEGALSLRISALGEG